MRKIANGLQLTSLFLLFIFCSVDVNSLTVWHVVGAVLSFIPFLVGKVVEKCLED